MKLAVVVCVALAALAQAEVQWDKSGQYRLVETEPYFFAPVRTFVPFVYSYKQVESGKTPEESMPSIIEVMPSMPELLPSLAEIVPVIAEVSSTTTEIASSTTEAAPIISEPIEQ